MRKFLVYITLFTFCFSGMPAFAEGPVDYESGMGDDGAVTDKFAVPEDSGDEDDMEDSITDFMMAGALGSASESSYGDSDGSSSGGEEATPSDSSSDADKATDGETTDKETEDKRTEEEKDRYIEALYDRIESIEKSIRAIEIVKPLYETALQEAKVKEAEAEGEVDTAKAAEKAADDDLTAAEEALEERRKTGKRWLKPLQEAVDAARDAYLQAQQERYRAEGKLYGAIAEVKAAKDNLLKAYATIAELRSLIVELMREIIKSL